MNWHLLLFNIVWLGVVFGQVYGVVLVSYAALVCFYTWHFLITKHRRSDLTFMCLSLVLGGVIDALLLYFSVFRLTMPSVIDWCPPLWLLGLWAAFSLFFRYGLRFLHSKRLLLMGLGGVFGPLSYFSGYKLGLIVIPNIPLFFILECVLWSGLMFSFLYVHLRIHT